RVILNISGQKVVKNSFNTGRSFIELFNYFYNESPQEISRALSSVGIEIGPKTNEQTISENVSNEEKAITEPEPASPANIIVSSEGDKVRRRKRSVSKSSSESTA